MSEHYPECSSDCEVMPDCVVCRKRKAPRGRSIPPAAAGTYCDDWNCKGYLLDPRPGHLWPGELEELRDGS